MIYSPQLTWTLFDLIVKEPEPLEGGVRQCKKGAKRRADSLFIAWTPLVHDSVSFLCVGKMKNLPINCIHCDSSL